MPVTNEGLNYALSVAVNDGTKVATWYIGLISSASYLTLASADSMSSHAGWTEFVGYSEAVRQTWVEAAAASQSVLTSTNALFTANATGTVKGFFLASVSTKSGTTGTLLLTKLFADGDRAVVSGDQITLNLTLTGIDATV